MRESSTASLNEMVQNRKKVINRCGDDLLVPGHWRGSIGGRLEDPLSVVQLLFEVSCCN
jgi:hypothetical protein